MELLPAIVGLAVVDSINPSALLATVALLLRGRRARPLVAVYLVAVLTTYFATGVVLILGFGLTPWAVIESDAAYLAQGVLGAAMLAYALAAPGRRRQRGSPEPARLPTATRPVAVFAVGMAIVLELPTALPYLGAVGAVTRADVTLGRLRDRLGGAAREGFLWLLGLIGFCLLADALGHFQIIG
jgi:hypothetical protein